MSPKSNDWCPYKKRCTQIRLQRKDLAETEVEVGVMKPRIARSHQKLEEARKNSSLEP